MRKRKRMGRCWAVIKKTDRPTVREMNKLWQAKKEKKNKRKREKSVRFLTEHHRVTRIASEWTAGMVRTPRDRYGGSACALGCALNVCLQSGLAFHLYRMMMLIKMDRLRFSHRETNGRASANIPFSYRKRHIDSHASMHHIATIITRISSLSDGHSPTFVLARRRI